MAMRFYPLGHPVDVVVCSARNDVANREAVLAAASKSWSAWPALFDQAPMRFEIETHHGPVSPDAPTFEAPAGWLTFSAGDHNFAAFELESRTGYISIGDSALRDEAAFRHHWLEALVLTALDSVFFTPLHAACVARDGAGTLLCGDSGAGKSSLAYACARRGWTLVSDDAVHLAPGPERIGVGGSNLIHLREPVRALFPELDVFRAGRAPNGKQAIEIDAGAEGFPTARYAFASRCYFLRRRPGPAAVRPFPARAAIQYFLKYLFPRDTAAAERHLRGFLSPPPCVLEYEHIEDALGILES
jgi:hypothetical protein